MKTITLENGTKVPISDDSYNAFAKVKILIEGEQNDI